MGAAPWLEEIRLACARQGIDLARPFGLGAFHEQCAREHRLDDFGRPNPLALVLGNTRALWPVFLDALAARPALRVDPHPLDRYVEEVVQGALSRAPDRHRVYWGHHRQRPAIALQRIAAVAGLAELGPAHLSVHPEHGPWIGLRAVVIFDVDASELPGERPSFRACATCPGRACVPALSRALATSQACPDSQGEPPPPPLLSSERSAWLAIREACPVGRGARYEPLQVHYHYTKDPRALEQALAARRPPPRDGAPCDGAPPCAAAPSGNGRAVGQR